jgi:hypothetical protein
MRHPGTSRRGGRRMRTAPPMAPHDSRALLLDVCRRCRGVLGVLLLLLPACAPTQQTFDAGARTALTVVADALDQRQASVPPPCPAAHYRLPVVTQVTVPDTIVGGVLIPRHATYVVVQPGAWQVVDTDALRQPGTPTLPPGCHPLPGGR